MFLRKTITMAELAMIDLFSVVGMAINVNGKIEIITADLAKKKDTHEVFDISRPMQYKNCICIKELHCKSVFSAVKVEGNMLMIPVAQEAVNIMLRNMQKTSMISTYFPGLSLFNQDEALIYKKTVESQFVLQKEVETIRIDGDNVIYTSIFDSNKVFRMISTQKAANLIDWGKSAKIILDLKKEVETVGRISGKNNPVMPITFCDGTVMNYHFAIKSLKECIIDIPKKMSSGNSFYLGKFSLSAKAQQINKSIHIFIDNAKICFADEYVPAVTVASLAA